MLEVFKAKNSSSNDITNGFCIGPPWTERQNPLALPAEHRH
jgi:hypothetical protein